MLPKEQTSNYGVVHVRNNEGELKELFKTNSVTYTFTPSIVAMDDYAKEKFSLSKTYSGSANVTILREFYMKLCERELINLRFPLPKKKRLRRKKVKQILQTLKWID